MAKKRDRHGSQQGRHGRDAWNQPAATEEGGVSFASNQGADTSQGDIRGWEEDQKTAPDLFADASDEDEMQADGGHPSGPGEEPRGRSSSPDVRRR
jgi:hypothetical protein